MQKPVRESPTPDKSNRGFAIYQNDFETFKPFGKATPSCFGNYPAKKDDVFEGCRTCPFSLPRARKTARDD